MLSRQRWRTSDNHRVPHADILVGGPAAWRRRVWSTDRGRRLPQAPTALYLETQTDLQTSIGLVQHYHGYLVTCVHMSTGPARLFCLRCSVMHRRVSSLLFFFYDPLLSVTSFSASRASNCTGFSSSHPIASHVSRILHLTNIIRTISLLIYCNDVTCDGMLYPSR